MPSGAELAAHPEMSAASAPDPSAIPAAEMASDHSSRDSPVLEVLKAANVPGDVVRGALKWVQQGSSFSNEQLAVIDAEGRASTQAEMRKLWPGEKYTENVKAINAYLSTQLSPSAADVIRHARDADGRAYMNDPANLQRLLGLALRPGPSAAGGGVDAQIKSIEAFMKVNRPAYTKDEPLQARYRELLAAKHGDRA
jgi:hypothetical protein